MRISKPNIIRYLSKIAAVVAALGFVSFASAQNLTLRIVCYNIEDDIANGNFGQAFTNNASTPLPGLISPYAGGTNTNGSILNGGVLEGIGEEVLADGVAQPVDVLALEETSGPSTVNPIITALNSYYSQYNPLASNMYAVTPYLATESGGATNDGNGPNSIIYNTKNVQLLASIPVDPIGGTSALGSASGEYREVMRYEFAPASQTPTAATEFYIYVSHYKSGSTSTDIRDRSGEAYIIRTNESASLPVNARVIYVGDYNISTSSEASYQTIITATPTNGVTQGQAVDPLNVSGSTSIDWTANSLLSEKTEEDYALHYRDDFQCCTTNIYNGAAGGLVLVANTYHTFGNNGSVAYEQSVTNASNSALNTDLKAGSPISASQLYLDLTGASDHLPVVADYTIPVIQPAAGFTFGPTNNGAAPLSITFTDASTGIVTNWTWSFGDGVTNSITNSLGVTHVYTNAGTYSVVEIVAGPGGQGFVVQSKIITVIGGYQSWQLQYFGCTNCPQAQTNADADGTGQNNLFKFVAGLNPTNPASVFVFTVAPVAHHPSEENLIFSPVVAGRAYTPFYTTNLATGSWQTLSPVTNINGVQATLTDTNAIQSQKYYKVEISSP